MRAEMIFEMGNRMREPQSVRSAQGRKLPFDVNGVVSPWKEGVGAKIFQRCGTAAVWLILVLFAGANI
jgi:hypothetical protein